MGFFDFLRFKALTATPAVLETARAGNLSPYRSLGSSPNASRAALQRINGSYVVTQNASYSWLYLYNPHVRAVVDYIARNFAELGLKVYERISDDEREHRGDHPAAQALRYPNEWRPGSYFMQEFVKAHLIFGNSYALKFRADNGDLTLVPLPPHLVGIVGDSYFSVDAYRIWRRDGSFFDVAPENVLHWPGTTGDDPRRGESLLETLRQVLAADAAAQQAVTELFASGLQAAAWIELPIDGPEISDEGLKRIQEGLSNQAKQGRGRYPILAEGMQLKTGGVSPEDAQWIEGRRWTQEYVASQFGMKNVPPVTEEERKQFYADVLPPLTDMCASILNHQILWQEYGERDLYFEFNPEKLMDERLKTLTSASGRPVLTTNEARAMINKPPIDGGDELVTPGNVIVGDNPKPSPQLMPIQDPNGPPQDGSHRSGDADKPIAAGARASLNGHHKAPLIPRRNRASKERDRWAGEYKGVFDRHFDRQRRSLKSRKAKTKAITDDRWNTELASGVNDVAWRQFEAAGALIAFRLAFTFDPNQGENWLAAKSIGAAEAINLTTQKHADESDLDGAFSQAMTRSAGAGMAYATDVAAFSTKVATEQAPGEPTVIIDGGTCEICAPYQGSWAVSELEAWPSYHPDCGCVADVEAGVAKSLDHEPLLLEQTKSLQVLAQAVATGTQDESIRLLAKAITEQKPPNYVLQVAEGAFKAHTPVEVHPAAVNVTTPDITVQPAEVNITQPDINIAPAEVHIEKGAISAPNINVEAPPPAQVNVEAPDIHVSPAEVHIEKGAITAPNVNVEAPPPADVTIAEGAIQVDVSSPDVTVESAPAPNVNVEVKGGKTKRTVKFSDGRTAEINEEES